MYLQIQIYILLSIRSSYVLKFRNNSEYNQMIIEKNAIISTNHGLFTLYLDNVFCDRDQSTKHDFRNFPFLFATSSQI